MKVKVWFPLGISDWHKQTHESMWASKMNQAGIYRLENSPLYAYGISYKDIFEAEIGEDNLLFFKKMKEKSGHSTYRIIALDHRYDDVFKRYWSPIEKLGCSFESNAENWLYSVDVPQGVDIKKVYELFEIGENDNVWGFEESDYGRKR